MSSCNVYNRMRDNTTLRFDIVLVFSLRPNTDKDINDPINQSINHIIQIYIKTILTNLLGQNSLFKEKLK